MIQPKPGAPFDLAFSVALPHGMLVGVHLPVDPGPLSSEILSRLHPPERLACEAMHGYRAIQFAGGRLAAAAVLRELGAGLAPILVGDDGAPGAPAGVALSISHKQDLAVAMAARGGWAIGVDLEDVDRARPGVARRVLTDAEFAEAEALPEGRRWIDAVVRFAVKECIYKALQPRLRRYIGFGEAEVRPDPSGADQVRLLMPEAEAWEVEARHTWLGERVLASVRARPRSGGPPA